MKVIGGLLVGFEFAEAGVDKGKPREQASSVLSGSGGDHGWDPFVDDSLWDIGHRVWSVPRRGSAWGVSQ